MEHTKPVRSEDIDTLMGQTHPPAVSLYLPTVRAGREVRQNAIRFGNLLRDARTRLAAYGLDEQDQAALLGPLEKIREDDDFWQHQSSGLAVFRDARRTVIHPLPVEVQAAVHVGERFTIRPLLPLVHFDGRFHVLEFGQDTVRLHAGTRFELRPVMLPEETPTGLTDVVGARLDGPHIQHHGGNGAGQSAIFHGQGAGESAQDGEMRKYATWVARTVVKAMDPGVPVVLAGTESTIGLFRSVADWPALCDEWINGAPGRFAAAELHRDGWAIVEPLIRERRMSDVGDLDGLESKGRALCDLDAALTAAHAGRVDALYLTDDLPHDSAYEELARKTWRNGGRVYQLEAPAMTGDRRFAVVLRY